MYILFLIVGFLTIVSTSQASEAQAEEHVAPHHHTENAPKPQDDSSVTVIAATPIDPSIKATLAAPDDSYVEGKDLNSPEDPESPDEADEDGEEEDDEASAEEEGTDAEDE
jgi:hypothetical protein